MRGYECNSYAYEMYRLQSSYSTHRKNIVPDVVFFSCDSYRVATYKGNSSSKLRIMIRCPPLLPLYLSAHQLPRLILRTKRMRQTRLARWLRDGALLVPVKRLLGGASLYDGPRRRHAEKRLPPTPQ